MHWRTARGTASRAPHSDSHKRCVGWGWTGKQCSGGVGGMGIVAGVGMWGGVGMCHNSREHTQRFASASRAKAIPTSTTGWAPAPDGLIVDLQELGGEGEAPALPLQLLRPLEELHHLPKRGTNVQCKCLVAFGMQKLFVSPMVFCGENL